MVMVHFKSKNKISILCNSCFIEITEAKRVRCIDCCTDECLDCFIISLDNNMHEDHKFNAIDVLLSDSITKWKIIDEFVFFECLKKSGIGNFNEIAQFIFKPEEEVESHFFELFEIKNSVPKKEIALPNYSNPNFHKVWSFMPKREDFDNQLRDDFEKVIRDVKLELDDPDFVIKKQMLSNYKTIKLLRKKRDSFILKRGLFNMPELIEKENKYDNLKRKILKQLKPIAQFISKNDFNLLLEGIYIEKRAEEILNTKKSNLCLKEEEFIKNMNIQPKTFFSIKKLIVKSQIKDIKLNSLIFERKFSFDHTQYRKIVDFFGSHYFDLS